MNDTEKRKLQSILRKLDTLRNEVEELLGSEIEIPQRKTGITQEAESLINSINSLSISELKAKLEVFGHKDLGDVFVGVGGSSVDKRKPKAWLIDRILWLAKEFSEGHKAIRES